MPTFYIIKASSTVVCPTLVEKSILPAASRLYIWVITNDATQVKYYVTATEESTELQRYNKFTLIETANPDPLNGEIELPTGGYKYEIYEKSNQVMLGDLSLINYTILTLVEQGILKCNDTAVENTEFADAPLTNTEYVGP